MGDLGRPPPPRRVTKGSCQPCFQFGLGTWCSIKGSQYKVKKKKNYPVNIVSFRDLGASWTSFSVRCEI